MDLQNDLYEMVGDLAVSALSEGVVRGSLGFITTKIKALRPVIKLEYEFRSKLLKKEIIAYLEETRYKRTKSNNNAYDQDILIDLMQVFLDKNIPNGTLDRWIMALDFFPDNLMFIEDAMEWQHRLNRSANTFSNHTDLKIFCGFSLVEDMVVKLHAEEWINFIVYALSCDDPLTIKTWFENLKTHNQPKECKTLKEVAEYLLEDRSEGKDPAKPKLTNEVRNELHSYFKEHAAKFSVGGSSAIQAGVFASIKNINPEAAFYFYPRPESELVCPDGSSLYQYYLKDVKRVGFCKRKEGWEKSSWDWMRSILGIRNA